MESLHCVLMKVLGLFYALSAPTDSSLKLEYRLRFFIYCTVEIIADNEAYSLITDDHQDDYIKIFSQIGYFKKLIPKKG